MNKKTFIERAEEILRSMFVDKDKDNHWGTPETAQALYQLHIEGVREEFKLFKKQLPKELGFEDYDKHIHIYATENRGNCGICGLSWKKTTEYGFYNTALSQVKKLLREKLKK